MKLYLLLLLSGCVLSAGAQNTTGELLKQQFINDWQRAKQYTQEYLDAMPADKYNFRPIDSVRTFAEQMLHFALSNTGMAFIATGYKNAVSPVFFDPAFGTSASAKSKDSVVYYVNTSYQFMIDAITSLDVSKMNEAVSWNMPGGKRTGTRTVWILKAFEHQTHHRGQCTVYLRTAGIKPPAERLWE
jgi:uncharacterized damage-inducible protein DinB